MFKVSYNFARFGLDAVAAYALWTHGWGAVDPATRSPVPQKDEYDFDIQWRPKSGFLDGLWFRARYARVDARGASTAVSPSTISASSSITILSCSEERDSYIGLKSYRRCPVSVQK